MEHVVCLINFVPLQPLKSAVDFTVVMTMLLTCPPFNEYLRKYCCPFPADPPSFTLDKFYMRQLQTSSKCWTSIGIPRATARPDNAHDLAHLRNLLPMLGPLHVSLNTQVMLVKQNRSVFKRLYESSTGNKLPKKPRSWRIIWIL